MSKRALVILGAGAAHDLIPMVNEQVGLGLSQPVALGSVNLSVPEPPLTKDVFRASPHTQRLLDTYKRARDLSGPIRIALHRDDQQLEPLLKQYYDADEQPIASQFPEIPLYLQDLFTQVSQYTNQPVNYQQLAHRLFSAEAGFEKVAFLTLNYDTLLDDMLFPDFLGGALEDDVASYIGDRCMLVKLHGSVNWVKECEIEWPSDTALNLSRYLDLIASFGSSGLRTRFQSEITVRKSSYQRWQRHRADREIGRCTIYYPALSVPLGEYDMYDNCPRSHIEELKGFLKECRNVLAIGVSGRDGDLLKLLEENLPENVHSFWLVDKGKENTKRAYSNFVNACPKLKPKWPHNAFPPGGEGFTDFILHSEWGLDKFITGSQ